MTWPIRNEVYGTLLWLRREVGGYLGYGYNQDGWNFDQKGQVDSIINSGVMQFYYPPPLPVADGRPASPPHQWTFLTPLANLDVKAGTDTYDMPDDFSGVVNEFTGTDRMIAVVPEATIRSLQQSNPQDGTPLYAAVRPKRTDGQTSQRWEVVFYPKPDTDKSLSFRYTVTPQPLTEEKPYPLGGSQYSETILQSCLALAEERLTKQAGPATARFLDRLAAAIKFDASASEPAGEVWPIIDTALEGLKVSRGYLKRIIGRFLGFGPSEQAWTHQQQQEVILALQCGLRKFYNPVPIRDEKISHMWSFLRPLGKITLVSGQYEYELPEDFEMLDSPLTFAPGSSVLYPPIDIVGEHQIRQRLQRSEASARPRVAAIVNRSAPALNGSLFSIWFWPVPDQAYELTYRYQVNPIAGRDDGDLPFGGPAHGQTLVEACLAACEEQMGKLGAHTKLFLQSLDMSIAHDRRIDSPANLGYNRDRSDRPFDQFLAWHDCDENLVTYNGNVF